MKNESVNWEFRRSHMIWGWTYSVLLVFCTLLIPPTKRPIHSVRLQMWWQWRRLVASIEDLHESAQT